MATLNDKASDKTINKVYANYKLWELNQKHEKTAKNLGCYLVDLYSTGAAKVRDVQELSQILKNELIIKGQVAN